MNDQEFRESVITDLAYIKAKLNNGISKKQEDHESRIRFLEKGLWLAIGGFSLLEIILKLVIK